jgi:ferredoxin/flavodoxin
MKIALIFVSGNGTTEKVSDLLATHLMKRQHKVDKINLGRSPYRENDEDILKKINTYDVIGLGSPVYHMDMFGPMLVFLNKLKEYPFKKMPKAFIYLTYSGITTGKAFIKTIKTLNDSKIGIIAGMKIRAPHFHHKDEVLDIDKIDLFTKKFCDKLEKKQFSQIPFEKEKVLFSPEKKRVNILFPIVHIVGRLRELPIKIDQSECRKCGKCERECPSGAIQLKDKTEIDFSKCLHCYHCVTTCPFQAITSPIHEIDQMIKINKKIVGMENPVNNLYV